MYRVHICHTRAAQPQTLHPYHDRDRALESAQIAARYLGPGGTVHVTDAAGRTILWLTATTAA